MKQSIDAQPAARLLDRCPYFQRTSVIMADGEVVTCANFYAQKVGDLQDDGDLSKIWHGERMTSLRRDFGTENEWPQCRSCWFREIGYAKQREEWHEGTNPSVETPTVYTKSAWDFTRFSSDE